MKDMNAGSNSAVPKMSDTKTKKNPSTATVTSNSVDNAWNTKRISRRRLDRVLATVLILLCVLGGFLGARFGIQEEQETKTISEATKNDTDGNTIVTESEQNITGVVEKVSKSVVSIVTTQSGAAGVNESAGTGIILSADGYIMTNHHVLGDASQATIVLSDGVTYKNVKVIGNDPLNDLAFLKVDDAKNLSPASIGTSSTLRVGQQVVAIGNALGQYQNTVSSGILSGTGRPVAATDGETTEQLTDLLQTDTAINSGNSGGPLLNLSGQVIGINTAVAQDAQGIGFAIPIDAAKGEIASVLANKGVQRSYLGVNYVDITPSVTQRYGLPVRQGAYVYAENGSAIAPNSPAARAGIKNKDIIVAINDTKLGTAGGLSTQIGRYQPDVTVKVTILRDGKEVNVDVKLDAYKEDSAKTLNDTNVNRSFLDQLFGE